MSRGWSEADKHLNECIEEVHASHEEEEEMTTKELGEHATPDSEPVPNSHNTNETV